METQNNQKAKDQWNNKSLHTNNHPEWIEFTKRKAQSGWLEKKSSNYMLPTRVISALSTQISSKWRDGR